MEAMETSPDTVRATNQSTMSGPNALATLSVPLYWKTKRTTAIPAAIADQCSLLQIFQPGNEHHPFHGGKDTDGGGNDPVA